MNVQVKIEVRMDQMKSNPSAVVFDLGGVLIDVDPRYLYRQMSHDEARIEHFLAQICTPAWNFEQDRGRSTDVATEELIRRHPPHADWIRAYYGEHGKTFRDAIAGTVEILQALKDNGVPVFALSNWNGECFQVAEARFPFLDLFEDIVVSGRVGLCKPELEIYELASRRFGYSAQEIFFIDDREENLEPAIKLDWRTHLYRSPDALERSLLQFEILQ